MRKRIDYEIDVLCADKHKNFPQIDSITLGVNGQAYPNHPKQQLYNIFAICHFGQQSWLQGHTIIIDKHDEAFSNYSNYFKKGRNGVYFLHADKHQSF